MLVMKERQPPFRTAERWARLVLLEVGAIRECEEHGWMRDRADPHARDRAVDIARRDPRRASLRMRQRSKFGKPWIRSATPAPSARRHERRARDVTFCELAASP